MSRNSVPPHLLQRNQRTIVEKLTDHPYDPDTAHKRGCFPCCRWAWLLRATPDDALYELHRGGISQDEYEAYMHVWATASARFSTPADQWRQEPEDAAVATLATAFHLAVKINKEAQ